MKELIIMKSLLVSLGTILSAAVLLFFLSFDWPSRDNGELRGEMLSEAGVFLNYCDSVAGNACGNARRDAAAAAGILRDFIAAQAAVEDPYSWIGEVHGTVAKLKGIYPPQSGNEGMRRRILQLLDYPLHVDNFRQDAPAAMLSEYYGSVFEYLSAARDSVFKVLDEPVSGSGMELVKWYNMGFVMKTAGHTVAIDITDRCSLPVEYTLWEDEDYKRFAQKTDILFLTHPHSDHYSLALLKAMVDEGKTVVLPCSIEGLVCGGNGSGEIVIIDSTLNRPVTLAGGVEVMVFHGDQGEDIPCNIYLLDIDGHRVVHNGDNYDRGKEALLRNYPPADIIIASSWNKVQSLLSFAGNSASEGQIFIPAHENELCHGVSNRESYHELFTRKDRLGNDSFHYPRTIVLDNGEKIDIILP